MEKVCNYVQCFLFVCRNLHNNSLCNKSCLPLEGAAVIDSGNWLMHYTVELLW